VSRARQFVVFISLQCTAAFGLLWVSGQVWESTLAEVIADNIGTELQRTGGELNPYLSACALISLAVVVGVVATGKWARRLVAGIGVIASVVAAWSLPSMPEGTILNWQIASGLLILVLLLTNGAALLISPAWPSMGARYQRTKFKEPAVDVWGSLDRGVDPTIDGQGFKSGD